MRRVVLLVMLAMAAGCSHTHTAINARASAVPAAGSTVTGGSVRVHFHSHSLAALVIAGMFMAAAVDYNREPRPLPSFSGFADWFRGAPPPPELDSARRVNEQDCTRPIDESSGNLRCR